MPAVLRQIRTLGHICTGECICSLEVSVEGVLSAINPECSVKGHSANVLSVALSADGNSIVSGSADNLVKIWDVKTGAEVSIFVGTR